MEHVDFKGPPVTQPSGPQLPGILYWKGRRLCFYTNRSADQFVYAAAVTVKCPFSWGMHAFCEFHSIEEMVIKIGLLEKHHAINAYPRFTGLSCPEFEPGMSDSLFYPPK